LFFKRFEVIELAMIDVDPTFFINKNELLWAICSPLVNWDVYLLFIPNDGDHYGDQIPSFGYFKRHIGKFSTCECFFVFFKDIINMLFYTATVLKPIMVDCKPSDFPLGIGVIYITWVSLSSRDLINNRLKLSDGLTIIGIHEINFHFP